LGATIANELGILARGCEIEEHRMKLAQFVTRIGLGEQIVSLDQDMARSHHAVLNQRHEK
jgi:hypothetical protein